MRLSLRLTETESKTKTETEYETESETDSESDPSLILHYEIVALSLTPLSPASCQNELTVSVAVPDCLHFVVAIIVW